MGREKFQWFPGDVVPLEPDQMIPQIVFDEVDGIGWEPAPEETVPEPEEYVPPVPADPV